MTEPANSDSAVSDIETDRRLMAAALAIGRRNLGRTFPNPAVGALVVRHGAAGPLVVGRGWTGVGGKPHAETVALAEAGEAARGATLYVTLEPCNHTGRTPPCTEAIIAAGVSRVVTTVEDPDVRVAGQGHARLRAAGIAVTTGVLEDEARRANRGHIIRVTKGRPRIALKLAVSADGMIGRRSGERMIISGPEAFAQVHTMRAEADAVMIGIGTALVDDPLLNVRLPGLAARSPIRIILDSTARLKLRSRLVTSANEIPLWVVVGPEATDSSKEGLAKAGAEVIEAKPGSGGVALEDVLARLAKRGLTRILVEGGGKIASSLVTGGLVDEVILFRAAVVVGPDGVRALAGQALSAIERSPRYRLVEDAQLGEDRKLRYLRND